MPNILDQIVRVTWDTNEKELNSLNKATTTQDKLLEELRQKGRRLEEQMIKTNDPKKVAAFNTELQKTREQYNKQQDAVKSLAKHQAELHKQLRANNDPQIVKGLLTNLHKVEQELDSLTAKTATFGNKMGGLGKNLLSVAGVGAGAFGIYEIAQGLTSLYDAANEEAAQAEQGLLSFRQTLKNIGRENLFDTLVSQADELAKKYQNLFDNDDILAAQAKFIEGTKVTEEQLSKLIPIAIELAAKLGTDVTTASEMLVNSIIGRTSPELKRLGLNMKGLGDETSRVNEITGDFAKLLEGSVSTALQTSQGQTQQLRQELANLEETLGEKTLKLERLVTRLKLSIAKGIDNLLTTDEDRRNAGVQRTMESYFKEYEKFSAAQMKTEYANNKKRVFEANVMRRELIALYEQYEQTPRTTPTLRKQSDNLFRQYYYLKQQYEILYREVQGQTNALNAFNGAKSTGALNANAGNDAEQEQAATKVYKPTKKKIEDVSKKDPVKLSFKLDDDKDNLDKQAQSITDNKNKLYKQASENLDKLNSEQVLGMESTTDAEAAELEKQINNRKKANEEKKKSDEQLLSDDEQLLFNNTLNLASAAQAQLDIEQRKTDKLIALQEKRVAAAESNSKVSLKVEQDRLNELLKKRQQYERSQRVIDAAVITANQALAISGAISTIANSKNPVLIAANVIAILAGIASVVGSIRSINADTGFKEGGFTGDGPAHEESTAIGKRPYKYHKREFVMNEALTSKHRDMFEGLHNSKLLVNRMDDGSYYLSSRAIDTDSVVADHNRIKNDNNMAPLLYEIQQMKAILSQREVNINNNFDADGFGQSVAHSMGATFLKQQRRTLG